MAENARMLSDEPGQTGRCRPASGLWFLLAALRGLEGLETTLFIWSATRTAGQEANATPMLVRWSVSQSLLSGREADARHDAY